MSKAGVDFILESWRRAIEGAGQAIGHGLLERSRNQMAAKKKAEEEAAAAAKGPGLGQEIQLAKLQDRGMTHKQMMDHAASTYLGPDKKFAEETERRAVRQRQALTALSKRADPADLATIASVPPGRHWERREEDLAGPPTPEGEAPKRYSRVDPLQEAIDKASEGIGPYQASRQRQRVDETADKERVKTAGSGVRQDKMLTNRLTATAVGNMTKYLNAQYHETARALASEAALEPSPRKRAAKFDALRKWLSEVSGPQVENLRSALGEVGRLQQAIETSLNAPGAGAPPPPAPKAGRAKPLEEMTDDELRAYERSLGGGR